MKEIKAIIQPFMLEKVLDALHRIEGLPGCTVSQVEGHLRSGGKGLDERALEPRKRTKVEIVVDDKQVETVLRCLRENARTGKKGDGKIFVIACQDVMRIRTGERGKAAI